MKKIIDLATPPILKILLKKTGIINSKKLLVYKKEENDQQNLEMYFDPEYSNVLENWGIGTTWEEIQMLLSNCSGKVLDIACGTGTTIEILNKYTNLEIFGCDISNLLIDKAIKKGIEPNKLLTCDATKMPYENDYFDYSYSIGSLEHFTENGIEKFISEASRITRVSSMHMVPTSKSHSNEGWMTTSTTIQTFYNNSDDWWMNKFKKHFGEVYLLNSKWNDEISFGRWFICKK